MIYQQLKEHCMSLGFESSLPSDSIFLSAANRALLLIAAERGVFRSIRIPVAPPKYSRLFRAYIHGSGKQDRFSLEGKAYSFRVSGSGTFTVTDTSGSRSTSFSSPSALYRGFLQGSASICFSGSYPYTVTRLSVFSDLPGAAVSDIPEADTEQVLQMKDVVSDFLCFSAPATDADGKRLTEIRLESSCVILPPDYSGEIIVYYRHLPDEIEGDEDTEEIDIPKECEVLLPLLTSSYLWLDDDEQKATYYMALYREAIAAIRSGEAGCILPAYENVTGW